MATNRVKNLFEVAKKDPFESLEKSFDSFFSVDPFDWLFGGALNRATPKSSIDVYEKENHYEVLVDVPGFAKEELSISLKPGILTVTGKKESTEESRRSRSEIRRTVALGDGLDLDNIEASLKDGVLTITIPKTKGEPPKSIEIK